MGNANCSSLLPNITDIYMDNATVILVGLSGCGKTCIGERLSSGALMTHRRDKATSPTIGYKVHEFSVKSTKYIAWELGGEEGIVQYWKQFASVYPDAIVFVVDSLDVTKRSESTKNSLHDLCNTGAFSGLPLLVLNNKKELTGSVSGADLVMLLKLNNIPNEIWRVYDVSVHQEPENLEMGFNWLAEEID